MPMLREESYERLASAKGRGQLRSNGEEREGADGS